jgi:hypothetical protein
MKFKSLRHRGLTIALTIFVVMFSAVSPASAATIAAQAPSIAGVTLTYTAAAASQDFVNTGKEFVHVKNGSVSPVIVTFTAAHADNFNIVSTAHDLAVTVPATSDKLIGPFDVARYNTTAGKVGIVWASTTTMTLAIIKPQ